MNLSLDTVWEQFGISLLHNEILFFAKSVISDLSFSLSQYLEEYVKISSVEVLFSS